MTASAALLGAAKLGGGAQQLLREVLVGVTTSGRQARMQVRVAVLPELAIKAAALGRKQVSHPRHEQGPVANNERAPLLGSRAARAARACSARSLWETRRSQATISATMWTPTRPRRRQGSINLRNPPMYLSPMISKFILVSVSSSCVLGGSQGPVRDMSGLKGGSESQTLPAQESRWTAAFGRFCNGEPRRPLLVSALLYLCAEWCRDWAAETLFLDAEVCNTTKLTSSRLSAFAPLLSCTPPGTVCLLGARILAVGR